MTLNANALTTVEHVVSALKAYPFIASGVSFDDADVIDEIIRLINYWSSFVETTTNNTFGEREYTEFYRGTSHPTLALKHYPVTSLVSIDYISSNGEVIGSLDVDTISLMLDERDLERGLLYYEPSWAKRYTVTGIIPDIFAQMRSIKITYTAGYVLPKDATDDVPSTLPSVLEELVTELAKAQFIANTDSIRANNLISLTEGNVQRIWANPTEFKLTSQQERILSLFKRKGV